MTRENAILCLKGIKNYGRDTFTEQSDWQESLDMAIKALEQEPTTEEEYEYVYIGNGAYEKRPKVKSEPTTKNNLGVDCISRADALRVAKNEYLRGWHNALCKALSEKYSIHCEEGNFSVIQEETITGLGLSMNCAVGKDVESFMSSIPSITPIRPKGHWIEEKNDYGEILHWHCSNCYDDSGFITTCKWDYCPNCGAEMEGEGE